MFTELLERLAHVLDEARLPYMIIGGQAVLFYGEPRLTRDIDITLGVDIDRQPDVTAAAAKLGLTLQRGTENNPRRYRETGISLCILSRCPPPSSLHNIDRPTCLC